MKKIYLDNAATTPIRPEVISVMTEVLQNDFGNASSSHSFGRSAKNIIELSRKSIAKILNCSSQEIIFTSNATEATNWILESAVKDLGIKRIITSKIEHHATLHTVARLQNQFNIDVEYISINPDGTIDYQEFESKIISEFPTLVSLMHVNNETGVVLDFEKIGSLCKQHKALFHCDTVQTIGKFNFDLNEMPIDFLVASAHKFHGPKGVGFAFVKKNNVLKPLIVGGEQEKGMRAGTEANHQIAGMAKALEIDIDNLEKDSKYISELKQYCKVQLLTNFPEMKINGNPTFYNILNVQLPFSEDKAAIILFNLDIKGIAVSRGSACQSGSVKSSHVLFEMLNKEDLKKPSLRISFSYLNTKEDIDGLIDALKSV